MDAGLDTNTDVEAAFPGSSCLTSTGSIMATFLVNEELVPIKIENILGDYRIVQFSFYNLCLIYR